MRASTVRDDYAAPRVRDFGGLTQLTSDFDASFHGSVAKIVSLAVASVPIPGGGNTDPTGGGNPVAPTTGGGVLDASNSSPTSGSGTSTMTPGTSGGGTGEVLDSMSRSGDPSSTDPASTLGDASRAANSATVGAIDTGGRLPFTGYAVMLTAGIGAALTGSGAALRSKLRRTRA